MPPTDLYLMLSLMAATIFLSWLMSTFLRRDLNQAVADLRAEIRESARCVIEGRLPEEPKEPEDVESALDSWIEREKG